MVAPVLGLVAAPASAAGHARGIARPHQIVDPTLPTIPEPTLPTLPPPTDPPTTPPPVTDPPTTPPPVTDPPTTQPPTTPPTDPPTTPPTEPPTTQPPSTTDPPTTGTSSPSTGTTTPPSTRDTSTGNGTTTSTGGRGGGGTGRTGSSGTTAGNSSFGGIWEAAVAPLARRGRIARVTPGTSRTGGQGSAIDGKPTPSTEAEKKKAAAGDAANESGDVNAAASQLTSATRAGTHDRNLPSPMRIALIALAALVLIGALLMPRIPAVAVALARRRGAVDEYGYPLDRRSGIGNASAPGTRGGWSAPTTPNTMRMDRPPRSH
jgi:hypothetical protein